MHDDLSTYEGTFNAEEAVKELEADRAIALTEKLLCRFAKTCTLQAGL